MSPFLNSKVVSLADVPTEDAAALEPIVVLIVDDERVIADTLALILARHGYSTCTAYNATSALEMARHLRPQLVISDVVMPVLSGVQLAIILAEVVPECRILLFSGQAATMNLLDEAHELGHDFMTLTKPIHPTDLLKKIAECFAAGQSQPWTLAAGSSKDSLLEASVQ